MDPHRAEDDARLRSRRRPTDREKPRDTNEVPADAANDAYLSQRKRSRRAIGRMWAPGRRGHDPGLHRPEVRRANRVERRRCRRRNPKSEAGRRSVPIPERLVPALKARLDGRARSAPAIASPRGSRLGLENWKRAVNWKAAIAQVGRERLRVHDLRHTYASLSRRAGADLRLLQKAMGHASITVTAHTYADLFDDELDNIAAALDSLTDDLSEDTSADRGGSV